MAEGGAVHKFPLAENHKDGLGQVPSTPPVIVSLGNTEGSELLKISRDVLRRGRSLVDFLDSHRDVARQAGVETLAVEISGVLEGGRLQAVVDTLEESSRREATAQVSMEGFDAMRRVETLLAEAVRNIDRFSPAIDTLGASGLGNQMIVSPQQGSPTIIQMPAATLAAAPAQDSAAFWAIFGLFAFVVTVGVTYVIVRGSGHK